MYSLVSLLQRCAEKLATHAQSVGIECTIRAVGDIDPEETLTRQVRPRSDTTSAARGKERGRACTRCMHNSIHSDQYIL